ncbi:hypothetical protein JCM9279_002960 [Rhodotorula babjevae]
MAGLDTHTKRGHVVTFSLLIFFSLIEWAIAAYLVNTYNHNNNYPSNSVRDRVRFLLFTGLWTFFFSIFYLVGFLKATTSFLFSIASHVAWLFITWVFWLAGTAAFAASLGGSLDCGNYDAPHCHTLNALEAFGWINFVIITLMFAYALFAGARSARSGNGFGGAMVDV